MSLSILIPVLDDAPRLRGLLADLQPGQGWGVKAGVGKEGRQGASDRFTTEIVVIDGGSRDDSVAVAKRAGVAVLECARGRGFQLDNGVRAASGQWLWFLHADSRVSTDVINEMHGLCEASPTWGRFDVRLADSPMLRLIALAMNWRSAITGICTGDQGIFVHRSLLDVAGGVPRQSLMEDIELSKRLRRLKHPLRIRTPIHSSPRRWHKRGVLKTVLLMWWLRFRYSRGAAPEILARRYYG